MFRKIIVTLVLAALALPAPGQDNISAAQQAALHKIIPYVKFRFGLDLKSHLVSEEHEYYRENGKCEVIGSTVYVTNDIEYWDESETVGGRTTVTTVRRDYLKSIPLVMPYLSGFCEWFMGVAGMDGYEEKNVTFNGAAVDIKSGMSQKEEYPNSYFLERAAKSEQLFGKFDWWLDKLNASLATYDIISIDDKKVVVYKMVSHTAFGKDLNPEMQMAEALAIAVAKGLSLEVMFFDTDYPGNTRTVTLSFDDIMKRF